MSHPQAIQEHSYRDTTWFDLVLALVILLATTGLAAAVLG